MTTRINQARRGLKNASGGVKLDISKRAVRREKNKNRGGKMKRFLMFAAGAFCAVVLAGCCCGKCDKAGAPKECPKAQCAEKKCAEKKCCPKCACPKCECAEKKCAEKKCCPKCACPKCECAAKKCAEKKNCTKAKEGCPKKQCDKPQK